MKNFKYYLCIILILFLFTGCGQTQLEEGTSSYTFLIQLSPATTAAATVNYKEQAQQEYSNDIYIVAQLLWCEARGIESKTEKACVVWTILNRYDSGRYGHTITQVALAPHQFAYRASASTIDDTGLNLEDFVAQIFAYWLEEKDTGSTEGRVLPNNYFFFHGDGKHNYFRQEYHSHDYWDYSLNSPYED